MRSARRRRAPRNSEASAKILAEFITKTANYLHDRGRTVVFWGEYPLKPDDIAGAAFAYRQWRNVRPRSSTRCSASTGSGR